MNEPTKRSTFPRLDILDGILTNRTIDPYFVDFAMQHDNLLALIMLGAMECGITKPADHELWQHAFEGMGKRLIEDFIDHQLEKAEESKVRLARLAITPEDEVEDNG
jgi:hypothetical protein